MDQERQIRFLYPPFFLLASLHWGIYLDPNRSLKDILPTLQSPIGVNELLGLIAGGSVIIIASGFLIGAISVVLLRITFFFLGRHHYEAHVSPSAFKLIWERLDTSEPLDTRKVLYAIATFDHELLPKSIHEWIGRRWSAFNVSAYSCIALVLALIIGRRLSITLGCEWLVTTLIIIALLAFNACHAWRDTMGMIDFQSRRHFNGAEGGDRKGNDA